MNRNAFATCTRSRPPRAGSVYIAVLGASMVIALVALTASGVGRLTLRSSAMAENARRAARHAQSGVDYALVWLNDNPAWRTSLTSGQLSAAVLPDSSDDGSFQWSVTDADGDLADDDRDHALLRTIGRSGAGMTESVAVLEVAIEPSGGSLSCLESAIHAASSVSFEAGAEAYGSGEVSSGGDVDASSAVVTLDVEAVGAITGGTYYGPTTVTINGRKSPGEHVFDWYVQQGTRIPLTSLPLTSGVRYLEWSRLGRTINDFGEVNPRGVYWIDCEGVDVRIRWTRLLGTLVLLNAGSATAVEDVALLQSEGLNHPVLLVDGDLQIDLESSMSGQVLQETAPYNFNPAGFPYSGGEDADSVDSYPSRIDGIVYATGTIRVADNGTVEGVLIADAVEVAAGAKLDVTHRAYPTHYPPPGFSAGQGVRLLPGVFRGVGL